MEEKTFSTNIKEIIEKYAWQRFMANKGFPKKVFYRKGRYYIDIRWGYVDFTHKTTRFEARNDDLAQLLPGDKSVILYSSEYENKTPLNQSYTFTTARETTASTTVEFQENYTIGAETSIEIKCPGDIVTVGAGLSGSMSVTKTEGETFEETVSWDVSTEISVKAGHRLKAYLNVDEKTTISDFEVETTMSLIADKKLPVAIRRNSDDKIADVVLISNLKTVFGKHAGPILKIKERVDDDNRVHYDVLLTTHGFCKSTAWKNQHVEVESEKMKDYDVASGSGSADVKDGE